LALPPVDWAVPEELMPGVCGNAWREALPAPLGSSLEFFNPPGAAGPGGTPLIPCDPAPAEPALGEPAALPLALPPDPPAEPPADPPDDPPELWASDGAGASRIAIAVSIDASFIEISFPKQRQRPAVVPAGTISPRDHSLIRGSAIAQAGPNETAFRSREQ
jgi:hypothetical protein